MSIRSMVINSRAIWRVVCLVNNVRYRLLFHGDLKIGSSLLYNSIIRVSSHNNSIEIEDNVKMMRCSIRITGNSNRIIIRQGCRLTGLDICIEDDDNTVIIGENTSCAGPVHLACIEGQTIEIGKNCMISGNVVMRVGDSHSVLNELGKRINKSSSIYISDHVWLGNDTKILKGVSIAKNSIVGTGSVVTKAADEFGSIIVGNPARVVKSGFNWDINRINCDDTLDVP